jgi:hypothetical protein
VATDSRRSNSSTRSLAIGCRIASSTEKPSRGASRPPRSLRKRSPGGVSTRSRVASQQAMASSDSILAETGCCATAPNAARCDHCVTRTAQCPYGNSLSDVSSDSGYRARVSKLTLLSAAAINSRSDASHSTLTSMIMPQIPIVGVDQNMARSPMLHANNRPHDWSRQAGRGCGRMRA